MQVGALDVPSVWLQLLERCAADPECAPTALRNLARQLAEQRALTAQQQQQLLDQQQQLVAQQRVAAQQGAAIAELKNKLQVLQSQLQQLVPRARTLERSSLCRTQ